MVLRDLYLSLNPTMRQTAVELILRGLKERNQVFSEEYVRQVLQQNRPHKPSEDVITEVVLVMRRMGYEIEFSDVSVKAEKKKETKPKIETPTKEAPTSAPAAG